MYATPTTAPSSLNQQVAQQSLDRPASISLGAASSSAYATPSTQLITAGQSFGPGSQQLFSFPASQQVVSFPGQPLYQNGGSNGFFSYGAQLNQTRMPYTSVPIGSPYNAVGGAGAPREPLGPSYLRSNSPMPTYLGAQPPSANVGGYQYFQSAAALASSPAQGFSSVGFAATRPPELNAASQYARPTSDTRLLSRFSPAASLSVSSDLTCATSQLTSRSDGVSDAGGGGRPRSESAAAATTTSSAYSPMTSATAAHFPESSSSDAHASHESGEQPVRPARQSAAAFGGGSSSCIDICAFSTTQGARKPAVTTLSAVARPRAVPASLPVSPASTPATAAQKFIGVSDSVVSAASPPGNLPAVAPPGHAI